MRPDITNIFVLMLENRSFDHLLGLCGLTGTDAVTGTPTSIRGLMGTETNSYRGQAFSAGPGALENLPVDPGHEFLDVLEQLCGTNVSYPPGAPYPPINSSGFVSDYALSHTRDEGGATGDFGQIMRGFLPDQLPVLNALARNFAVCDSWHASIPGPTWPNRLFALAASSAGLDHSPTTAEILTWETMEGIEFANGTLFDALGKHSTSGWRIYSADDFPLVAALKGIALPDVHRFDEFAGAVSSPSYPWLYTWIEPNYGDVIGGTYRGGNSQHPLDGIAAGEALIKTVYEAIRSSPHWNSSVLIITWDEHGGFYDHIAPPAAIPPGDTAPGSKYNQYGFTFQRYGVRVPAVIVSPRIPANLIDHRLYDHSCIAATLRDAYGLPALTDRDRSANSVLSLLSLPAPRTDTPAMLPTVPPPAPAAAPLRTPSPQDSVDSGNLPGLLHIAMRHDLALSSPAQRHVILARVQAIQTRAQAAQYIQDVRTKLRSARAAPP
ncbi:MAG TPA: alkaline phosphatase family protein [Steroidobacteraceae bacterium]|jgi:phospholipase C|nr:alkaline phosphatase family protein [Steroidobacteraceae bacterium]